MFAYNHIAYRCKDRIALERFYTKHFGFQRARVFNPGEPNEFVMTKMGGVRLEFFAAGEDAPAESEGPQKVGYMHLAFEVPDLNKKVAELAEDGIELKPIFECPQVVEGLRCCFLKDPEGNVIELMEGWKDEQDPPPLP